MKKKKDRKTFIDSMKGMGFELRSDIVAAYRDYDKEKTNYRRRNLIRAIFAFIEGHSHALRAGALAELPFSRKTYATIFILKEESMSLDRGKIKSKARYEPLTEALRFSFNTYFQIHNSKFELSASGKGWQALLKSEKVRNRITHPKTGSDLNVTDDEVQDAFHTYVWLNKILFTELMGSTSKTLKNISKKTNGNKQADDGILLIEKAMKLVHSHPFKGD